MSSVAGGAGPDGEFHLRTWRKIVTPRSPGQRAYMQAIRDNELVFGTDRRGRARPILLSPVPLPSWLPARSTGSSCRGRRSKPASGWASCRAT